MNIIHLPVLLEEVLDNLDPKPGDVVLDATVGAAGHGLEILKRILPHGRLIGIDRDTEAIERSAKILVDYSDNFKLINANFRDLDSVLLNEGVDKLDKALFDLGLSSFHTDTPERGFSFMKEGALDMRFDLTQKLTAGEVVNTFSEEDLARIIKEYGEERHYRNVARNICLYRRKRPIRTTDDLSSIINGAIGGRYRNQKINPSARTFQALRIFVNDELGAAGEGIRKSINVLSSGGRICVISFHSLEDRIVKNIFREMKKEGSMEIITKKPVTAGKEELTFNPRARSAKLRAAKKL